MFKMLNGYRLPTEPAEKIEILPATLGGGFIVNIYMPSGMQSMVFSSMVQLSQTINLMFNAQALANQAKQQEFGKPPVNASAPQPQPVNKIKTEVVTKAEAPAAEPTKRKGRPPLSAEEKAQRAAARKAKANGVDTTDVKAKPAKQPENEAALAA